MHKLPGTLNGNYFINLDFLYIFKYKVLKNFDTKLVAEDSQTNAISVHNFSIKTAT